MSSLSAPWQNGPYKIQHTEQHRNTKNTKMQQTFKKILFFVLFGFFFCFIYNFLNDFSKKCWVSALVQSMTFIGV